MRILILDDDVELAATLQDVLMLDGHDVSTVTSIAEARDTLADADPFDVAVFDLNLQNDNAIGLLREVKRDGTANRVLIMTGGGKVEADVGLPLATAHGADAVLFKPFSNDEFVSAVTGAS
ncbi:MAG: response regulator [Pseudomonadota bacterium]